MFNLQNLGSLPNDGLISRLVLSSMMTLDEVEIMRKGIKKGHCIKHGLLEGDNKLITKRGEGIRIRCRECTRNTARISYFKKHDHFLSYRRDWKLENREKINAAAREDRRLNPEKHKTWANKHIQKDINAFREKAVIRNHKMTTINYYEMLEDQNGLCAICHNPETRKSCNGKETTRLCIDHCHETNKIRGLLCHSCNTAIGKFKDKIVLLESAINYLRRNSE